MTTDSAVMATAIHDDARTDPRTERPPLATVARDHMEAVYRFALHLTADPHVAEDLTAETFLRATRAWESYDPRRGTPVTWLLAIARHAYADSRRANGRRQARERRWHAQQPQAAEAPDAPAETLSPALRVALATLNDREREVVALRVVLELDPTQAARVMGTSRGQVATVLHRALVRLRGALADSTPDTTETAL